MVMPVNGGPPISSAADPVSATVTSIAGGAFSINIFGPHGFTSSPSYDFLVAP